MQSRSPLSVPESVEIDAIGNNSKQQLVIAYKDSSTSRVDPRKRQIPLIRTSNIRYKYSMDGWLDFMDRMKPTEQKAIL